MYEQINSIDFSGEMKINDLYYLYKTNSSPINLQIYSKFQNFLTSSEFFKHYINKDIKIFFDSFDNFIQQLSSLSIQTNQIKFKSKIDQYISDFSYIYLLFNLISKLNDSLTSIILNTKNNLSNLYTNYHIDKNKQERFDEYINNILHNYPSEQNSQNILSKSSTKNNSNLSLDYNYLNWSNENNENNKQQILIKDLLGKEEEQNNILEILNNKTPKFNDINPSLSNKNNNNNLNINNQKNDNDNDNEYHFKIIRRKSDSEFTLSKKEVNDNNHKKKGKKKENENKIITNKESNDNLSNDISDYITSFNPDDFNIKRSKKRNASYTKKHVYSHKNLNICQSNDGNIKGLFNSYKVNYAKLKNDDVYKKMHVSSGHLFMKEESKIYAELLEIIIELYRKQIITIEQKLKLKKLIICKSPKILNVYYLYNHDNEKLIKELKDIIQ